MNITYKYCHNCGLSVTPNSKFCSNCGTSLTSLSSMPPEKKVETKPKPQVQTTFAPMSNEDDDEDGYIDSIASINELNISISALDIDVNVHKPRNETVGNLMNNGMQVDSSEYQRPAPLQLDQKSFIEQFKQEAGSLRNS